MAEPLSGPVDSVCVARVNSCFPLQRCSSAVKEGIYCVEEMLAWSRRAAGVWVGGWVGGGGGGGGGRQELTGARVGDHPREGSEVGSFGLDHRAYSDVVIQVEAQGPVVSNWPLCHLGCLKLPYHLHNTK